MIMHRWSRAVASCSVCPITSSSSSSSSTRRIVVAVVPPSPRDCSGSIIRQQQEQQQKQRSISSTTVRPFITTTTNNNNSSSSSDSSSSSSSSSNDRLLTFETTPLGKQGSHLLNGLDVYQVPSNTDGHSLSVYGLQPRQPSSQTTTTTTRPAILLLHGRTWSSVPVYHLLGGNQATTAEHKSRSLMEALYEQGLQPYAMDFRGFGGTHPDATGYVEPLQCVADAESVLTWIAVKQQSQQQQSQQQQQQQQQQLAITLMGWSQGALIAHLAAQKTPRSEHLGKLILYGSIYDPMVRYPREPLYRLNNNHHHKQNHIIENTFDMAVEDFTLEGTIVPEAAQYFAEAAIVADPIKAIWKHLYQFNNIDPARIQNLPVLCVAGDQDPYAPLRVQLELFANLGRGGDRTWSILNNCDHAVHLLENEGRENLIRLITSFVAGQNHHHHHGHNK